MASSISNTAYSKSTRALINFITELRALGAQADFDLPRIAVVGNQSVGEVIQFVQSSLIEAISGITVPRATGTCTRCPMECRLVHTPPPSSWKCQVLLRLETDEDGNRVTAKEIPFGPELHDKDELEVMLRRAQLAVLNPSLPPSFFEDFDSKSLKPGETPEGSERQLAFSNNVVCLDVHGPDVTDLSFIDLPGIISYVADGEDRGSIEAIKNMVTTYIQGNTLILLTITMRDDIDNQGAALLAKEADEYGLRTIGVLTKPDLIQAGEEDAWLRVLEGASHHLKHGYYIVKQPSPQDLADGISFEEARQKEAMFFENNFPWCTKPTLRNRMGTPNLTKELSRLLGNVINQGLSALRKDSKETHRQVSKDLESLPPPPPENAASELLHLVTSFSAEIDHLIQGREQYEALIQRYRPAYKDFKRDIRRTAPRMVPFKKQDNMGNSDNAFSDVLDSDEGLDNDRDEAKAKDSGIQDAESGYASSDGSGDVLLPEPMYLDEVRDHIERSLTRQLPHYVPFTSQVFLIERFCADWDVHCQKCFSVVHDATLTILRQCVESHFGRFRTVLRDRVNMIVDDLVERCRSDTLKRIDWMLKLENPPYTENDHYYSRYHEEYMTRYKKARQGPTLPAVTPEAVNEALAALVKIGHAGILEDHLSRLYGADAYERELDVMAGTSAYFHIAYKRIIDNIPRIIDHDFLPTIGKELQKALIDGLDLSTEHAMERARAYLAEDVEVAAQRQFLTQKKERLNAVLKKLYEFGI
ncbi:hypothetical protein NM688_g304 [Phlebia brevispora]|uniref:Uncharacterized protein n=1 Tax=Phlebia brevispora TaxID=194682 RepID=A0ACC1TEK4_9APHY|nr:hypothetical protein NM688_g304 [Phlebia brevispora]